VQHKIRKATRALQRSISKTQNDLQRPRYHFLPPANWMNDPNGTILYRGEYHLFYQFNPARPKWGNLHWGHAKSTDLIHWEHLPIALAPEGFPGEMHCWSGCCVIAEDGTPINLYTSMNLQALLTRAKRSSQQWMATGSPDLITWQKSPENPILSEEIHGDQVVQQWRDPYVWKEGAEWLMVLAGEYPGEKRGRVFLYRSPDLLEWEYVGLLATDPLDRGRGWECPNYFKLGDKYVLVVSPYGPVIYSVGEFEGQEHHADSWYTLDHGKAFYATNTYLDERGRVILVGWVKAKGQGWAGCLSLPREITLEDGQVSIRPVPELQALRGAHQHFERKLDTLVASAGTAPIFGERLEIKAYFDLEQAHAFGFKLIDDENEYLVRFDFPTRKVQVFDEQAQLQFVPKTGPLEAHLFIDHSVLEIFINQREVFTAAFRPQLAETHALRIALFVDQGKGSFWLDVWRMVEAPVAGSVKMA